MKAPASVVLVLAVCLSTVVPSSAAADKTLSNVRGTVSVDQGPGTTSQPVAKGASVAISDNDFAVTGGPVDNVPSQGSITLADSAVILVGQNTRVQMKAFDQQPNLTTANFVVANGTAGGAGGRIRFRVLHPGGAKANYTFQTSTGQIAVRGTEGDIWAPQAGALQVNVYEVTDPNLPVEVTLNNGKVYKLSAGQTLSVGIVGAAIVAGASAGASSSSSSASVTSTSQSTMSNFSEFGAVSNSAVVGAAAASAAAASSGGIPAIAAIAAGVAAVGGVVVGVSGGGSSEPSPSPPSVSVSASSLTFTPGTGPQTFTASQSGFSGAFHASIDQATVASVNATSTSGTFTVTPKSNGTATITVTGGSGATAPVDVTVTANKIVVPSSLPTFTSLNQKQNFTATETYYTGGFTAKSSNAAVAKVTSPGSSSSSAAGQFTVTSIANGNATITVSDGLGHTSPVSVTVTATAPSPTPTSIPICIGATTGGRDRDARHHMDPAIVMAPNKLSPAANPTCTPPPARLTTPVVRPPQPQPHPIGPQPPVTMPGRLPGMPTPPPMPGPPQTHA